MGTAGLYMAAIDYDMLAVNINDIVTAVNRLADAGLLLREKKQEA